MTLADPDVVTWNLTPAPTWGRTAYEATATCPHGSSTHILFGRAEIVMQAARDLCWPTVARPMRCQCPAGDVVIHGMGDDQD